MIRPKKTVRNSFASGFAMGIGSCSHYSAWENKKVELNNKIAIKFHQNPSEGGSALRGLVSEMYFNQIE